MNTTSHFEELLALLVKHKVSYIIIGGHAVAFHGYPRYTKDLEVFYELSKANVRRLRNALVEFAFPEDDLPESLFYENSALSFGVEPHRFDLLHTIAGVTFANVYHSSVVGRFGQVPVRFISRSDLLTNKKASGRRSDMVDAEKVEEIPPT
jgi:hypothetical protein